MQTFKRAALVLSLLALSVQVGAQGLFEGSSADSSASVPEGTAPVESNKPELTGYVKGALFAGQSEDSKPEILGSYGQTALKLKANKNGLGAAYAEVRLNAGMERGVEQTTSSIREAWGLVSFTGLDIKLGRQIIVWGRADGINPTNNITPKNELALSSEQDDTRMGNELLQIKAHVGQSSVQGIWVPYYRSDVLLLSSALLPANISLVEPAYPNHNFQNGSYALRFDFTAAFVDGSVSYFNGYSTMPGFDLSMGTTGLFLIPTAYRIQVIGGDFSTAAGAYGLRGELAAKLPIHEYKNDPSIPNPYAQLVLGIDRSIGDCSVLLQYAGLYVIDFKEINYGSDLLTAQKAVMNRLFTGTSDEFSHSLTANVQWNTLHETLHLKLSGLYNITTEEYAVVPDVSYDVADAVSLTVGARYLDGKKASLNDMVSKMMSHVYTELKFSF